MAKMEFNSSAFDQSNQGGFFVGPSLRIGTPVMGLGVEVSALYDQRELEVDNMMFTQKSLSIPGFVRMEATLSGQFGMFVCLGPQFDFNLGDTSPYWQTKEGDNRQFVIPANTLSANLGIGAIFTKFEISVFYNLPLGRTGDFTWDSLGSKMSSEWHHDSSRTNAWRMSGTYYF